jgi:YD repeat-containing protein
MIATRSAPPGWLAAIALLVVAAPRPTAPPAPAPGPRHYPGACRELHRDDFLGDEVVTWTYDVLGRPIRRDDASGTETLRYDADGRLVREIYPTKGRVEHAYDDAGNEIVTRYYEHDNTLPFVITLRTFEQGRLVEMREYADAFGAGGIIHRYTYHPGEMHEMVDGHETVYRYEASGRLAGESDDLDIRWLYRYDDAGNLIEKHLLATHGEGPLVRITYLYDCWQ